MQITKIITDGFSEITQWLSRNEWPAYLLDTTRIEEIRNQMISTLQKQEDESRGVLKGAVQFFGKVQDKAHLISKIFAGCVTVFIVGEFLKWKYDEESSWKNVGRGLAVVSMTGLALCAINYYRFAHAKWPAIVKATEFLSH